MQVFGSLIGCSLYPTSLEHRQSKLGSVFTKLAKMYPSVLPQQWMACCEWVVVPLVILHCCLFVIWWMVAN